MNNLIGASYLTMGDVYKSMYAQLGAVIMSMAEINSMFMDCPYSPMNHKNHHKTFYQGSMPRSWYREANQAIPSGKGILEERTFITSRFETKSQIDEMVAESGGMARLAFNRWFQARSHMQSNAQELADLFLYGSPKSDPKKAPGFYDYLSTTSESNELSKQIISFGGTGSDNASVLLVGWGMNSVHGIYDVGQMAGISRIDLTPPGGKKTKILAKTAAGDIDQILGYEEHFKVNHGLVVADQRQMARLANIDISDTLTDPQAPNAGRVLDILDGMIQLTYRIHNLNNGRFVWYCNRSIMQLLHRAALAKVTMGGGLTFDNFGGQMVTRFLGFPIRLMDAMLDTETLVS